MNPIDLIICKRDGGKLDQKAIKSFIRGVSNDSWPDYQVSAMLMAMYINGLDIDETTALTLAMAESGRQLDLSSIPGVKVDKHSTGGVADTTTLILVPLVAACGVPVVKMSGRGLGFTGGTIDKLDAVPGLHTDLDEYTALELARLHNMVILSQTENLTPADRKLYALRDVTGTIDSIPLIAASIMSKKIAAGADAIILDVKCGSGAFMQNEKDARLLAQTMTAIGRQVGRQVRAVISRMDQPLGQYVGNALEIIEAIEVLKGNAGGDLLELTLTLGSHLLCLAGRSADLSEARNLMQQNIANGAGLAKLRELITAQHGNPQVIDQYQLFPQAGTSKYFQAKENGYLNRIDTAAVGRAFVEMGGGRKRKDDLIDLAAGFIFHKRLADPVKQGELLAEIRCATESMARQAELSLIQAITIGSEPVSPDPLIIDIIG